MLPEDTVGQSGVPQLQPVANRLTKRGRSAAPDALTYNGLSVEVPYPARCISEKNVSSATTRDNFSSPPIAAG